MTYDDNGNLIGDGVDSFTCDTENHLVSASALENTISYAYDPEVGPVVARRQWDRKPASQQMREFLRGAVGRQFRKTGNGGHQILSDRAFFGL